MSRNGEDHCFPIPKMHPKISSLVPTNSPKRENIHIEEPGTRSFWYLLIKNDWKQVVTVDQLIVTALVTGLKNLIYKRK